MSKILIVDDAAFMRMMIKDSLKKGGYTDFIEAENGEIALAEYKENRPDLVLLDITMPVMDGIQALYELHKDDTLRHIPIIAVTASAMKGDQETILAHGFDGYLSKPIDAVLLKKTLREALD